jgi:hypothetical protein
MVQAVRGKPSAFIIKNLATNYRTDLGSGEGLISELLAKKCKK